MADYYNECGSCEYFRFEGDNRKGYCDYFGTYYYPTESCYHYKEKGVPSGCFLTTIVCKILGKEDNCSELETLRKFRDDIMQRDTEYGKMLFQYDTVGPIIAKELNEDYEKNGNGFAQELFNFFITPTCNLIIDGDYDKAVSKYTTLTTALMDIFSIDDDKMNESIKDYDFTTGGHGKVMIKK